MNAAGPLMPSKGQRVRVKMLAQWPPAAAPASLAGMQMKCGAFSGAEGVLEHLYGVAHSPEAKAAKRPEAIEFHLRTDEGELKVVTRPFNPTALGSVFVLEEENEATP